MKRLPEIAIQSPRLYVWLPAFLSLLMAVLVAVPTLSGRFTDVLPPLVIDPDPESMLVYDHPVRVLNREKKQRFTIYDLMVVGIVNKSDPNGVFNRQTLADIYDLANYAKGLQWQDRNGDTVGVISVELISPSNVDNIEQAGPGTVKFDWLMSSPPESDAQAIEVRSNAESLPILAGSLTSTNGKAMALYIPITSKHVSYKISTLLKERASTYAGSDEFFITGMATAQDTFGVQMFEQMAIVTPLAMMLIFGLLWFFFRNITLIVSPMIVAMVSVMITMGIMIVTGHAIHITTSMIPIFIMPIAVLDGIHILSEFYDCYPRYKDKRKAIEHVIADLSKPMLLTTITTAVGFAALNLMPLPPLQVFGTFVSIGVILAWAFTMTIIPAYIILMPERKFAGFGTQHTRHPGGETYLGRVLPKLGKSSLRFAKPLVPIVAILLLGSLYGASKLIPNDNPMRWFDEGHEIRASDKILNEMFAGSYMAYLSLDSGQEQAFKDPALLRYVEGLQDHINDEGVVGKTITVTEIIKTVHRELFSGDQRQYRIPDSPEAVAQTLITFQNSHRPNDLWHYVTPDYGEAAIWFQLKSGDNQDMIKVERLIADYMRNNPPPIALKSEWFGLTHVNVVWQDYMTVGLVKSFSGSFLIILATLIILFRSVLWGLLAMIPLTLSVAMIYGASGFIKGNLDTPLALLSAISIGLAVDYAIHFIVRGRQLRERYDSWEETIPALFGEPSRAIMRNVIVVGVGFLPLLIAPLVPYQMVGILLSSILILAGAATLFLLPALISLLEKRLFAASSN